MDQQTSLDTKLAAEARKFDAEARRAEIETARQELYLANEKRTLQTQQASDDRNHYYRVWGEITKDYVHDIVKTLAEWSRTDPGCDITIEFNCPGGSVTAGFALWDHLSSLKAQGHRLTTVVRGVALSMGGILLQAGDQRICGPEAVILIHEISYSCSGTTGQVEDSVMLNKILTRRILNLFESHTNMSKEYIKKKWNRKNWWIDSEKALELGLVDSIG